MELGRSRLQLKSPQRQLSYLAKRISVGLGLPRAVIGPENFHHPLNQSDAKPKPITTSWP